MSDKSFGIEDLLHTAKELEKWQEKDTDKFEINMNDHKSTADYRHERQEQRDYESQRSGYGYPN
jgi:hypothetical protein